MSARSHKYVWKKRVNGEWRYYYDNNDKPDKGLSIKNVQRSKLTSETTFDNGKGKKKQINSTTYFVNTKGSGVGGEIVDKDTYNRSTHMLYWKNEAVADVGRRAVKDAKKYTSKKTKEFKSDGAHLVRKGKSFVNKLVKKWR